MSGLDMKKLDETFEKPFTDLVTIKLYMLQALYAWFFHGKQG